MVSYILVQAKLNPNRGQNTTILLTATYVLKLIGEYNILSAENVTAVNHADEAATRKLILNSLVDHVINMAPYQKTASLM